MIYKKIDQGCKEFERAAKSSNESVSPRRFKSIPASHGFEDTRDLGLKEGEPFPPDHELVPRVWPKRPRWEWPCPRDWKNHPGAVLPYNDDIAKLMSGKP